MSKVVGLYCSFRKNSNSKALLEFFLEGADGYDVTVFNLADLCVSACRGCEACFINGACVIKDDMDLLYPLLEDADRIVVSLPVYFYGPPSAAKAVIDRCQPFWFRSFVRKERLKRKRGCFINVGAGKGENMFIASFYIVKVWFNSLNASMDVHLRFGDLDKEGAVFERRDIIEKVRNAGKEFFSQKA